MEMLGKIFFGIYLGWASWHDIREKGIPVIGVLTAGAPALLYLILKGPEKGQWMAMLPGMGMFVLSRVSNGIGEADGITLLLAGCIYHIQKVLLLFGISLIYIFLYSAVVFVIKRNRNSQIPYIPFILAAYITTWKIG